MCRSPTVEHQAYMLGLLRMETLATLLEPMAQPSPQCTFCAIISRVQPSVKSAPVRQCSVTTQRHVALEPAEKRA